VRDGVFVIFFVVSRRLVYDLLPGKRGFMLCTAMRKSGCRFRAGRKPSGGVPALLGLILCGAALGAWSGAAEILVPAGSIWAYKKGTEPPSSPPTAWREEDFDDSGWPRGKAIFGYGEPGVAWGTELGDMRYQYTTLFLRRRFPVTDAEEVAALTLKFLVDDGFAAWLNGVEIARYNVPEGELDYQAATPSAVHEPVQWQSFQITNVASFLHEGVNTLAVQMVNRSKTSSDLQFDLELAAARADLKPPYVADVSPPPGAVAHLDEITVRFNEPVQGIDPEDLLINGVPAEELTASGEAYTFRFPEPAYGRIEVSWAEGHGIADLGFPPNPFEPADPWISWSYLLTDELPPKAVLIQPEPGRVLSRLSRAVVRFSEPVIGVDAADLLVNGRPADSVSGVLNGPYVFEFAPAAPGAATISWAQDHGIHDLADPPNPFEPTEWSFTVDPDYRDPDVRITEILASNAGGLTDEDGEPVDWIELWNAGDEPADLRGWSLSDEADRPDKWRFPEVTLQPGEYLIVYASGKDRRTPGEPLHTNFKLAVEGEFLGLFNHEAPPRLISAIEPEYPEQRTDVSYGLSSGGAWAYYAEPTPGRPNSGPTLEGLTPEPQFSVPHGVFQDPFDLELSCADTNAVIRFTTDGSAPTMSHGARYEGPIRIEGPTVVRAAAFAPSKAPSRTVTATYLFPEAVLRQPAHPEGFPEKWGSTKIIDGDYAMDPRVVNDPDYTEMIRQGLTAIPSVSLAMPVEDWFSPDRGIYSNASREGIAWERAVSVELIFPDGRSGFQTEAGVRIQGGTSPINWKMEKLSLKLRFRSDYGPGWLRYPLFPDSPVRRFDTLILDAHMNNTWAYGGGSSPGAQQQRATYLRDTFASDLQLATGQPAVHGFFVHLYLNGLYWGLYELHEQPDEGFASEYFGGSKEEYDVLKHTGSQVLNGDGRAWNRLMDLVRSNPADRDVYERIGAMLDIPAFIDYMLVHFYVGNTDWPHHNWYAVRRRVDGAKWHFISWDSEHVMESLNVDRTGVDNANTCAEIYDRLRQNPEFRLEFADHVRRRLFDGGIFYVDPQLPGWDPAHPERNRPAALFHRRAAEIDSAIACESARWGDNQRPSQPYTRNKDWLAAIGWLDETFFPQRTALLLQQLRSRGLYPNLDAPEIAVDGGAGGQPRRAILTAKEGVIYYTLDGADPRKPFEGTPSASARVYSGEPVSIDRPVVLCARAFKNGQWSALTETALDVGDPACGVAPTELMYNPPGGSAYEFIELANTGAAPADLSGFSLRGVDFRFPAGSALDPGQVIVLASDADPQAFAERYPDVEPYGYFGNSLANGGESLRMEAPDGRTVWHVRYDDRNGWPQAADGMGYSIELVDPEAGLSDPANWRASAELGGSPGAWSPAPATPGAVRLQEVYPGGARGAAQGGDWAEIVNGGAAAVDLGGWQLADESDTPYILPAGLVLAPQERILIRCDGLTNAPGLHAPFALDHEADSLFFYDPAGNLMDALSFGFVPQGYSLGRDEQGEWTLALPTPGAPNEPAALGDPSALRLNEWLADPLPGRDDWLEVYNPSEAPVALHGLRIESAAGEARIRYLAFLAPDGFLRIVADDRSDRGHVETHLPGREGPIRLYDAAGALVDGAVYPDQQEDVSYGRLPDGTGLFQFLGAQTPGAPNSNDPSLSDRDGDQLPDQWEAAHGLDPNSAGGDNGANGDPDGDGIPNRLEYLAGSDPAAADPPLRLSLQPAAGGGLELVFPASPGRDYRIERSADPAAGEWESWSVAPAPSQAGELRVPIPLGPSDRMFFRVVRP